MTTDPEKIEVVQSWTWPATVREVLGLVGYNFISTINWGTTPDYSGVRKEAR